MRLDLAVGTTTTERLRVDEGRTIAFMGDALRVYSTPSMILDVEDACKDLLQEHLDPQYSSVGSHIAMSHLAPTLLEMAVEITVRVTAVDGRKVTFEAEVKDALDLVGQATHTRVIVDLARQAERLRAKRLKVSSAESG